MKLARSRRRLVVLGVVAVAVLALGVAATYHASWWGSYEHRLAVAVGPDDCIRVTTSRLGWVGKTRALNDSASTRFAAFCENVGPAVLWLHFGNVSKMRRALAATPPGPYDSVCVSGSRAEVVLGSGVERERFSDLCGIRDGRVLRYGPED